MCLEMDEKFFVTTSVFMTLVFVQKKLANLLCIEKIPQIHFSRQNSVENNYSPKSMSIIHNKDYK